jgi:RNA polymerase sigma factor (TIGR02999 family)
MDTVEQEHCTQLLGRARRGDQPAAEQLIKLVYDELREVAAAQLRLESPGHTLQPTSLVHEAFIKLIDQERVDWQGRTHFLALGAQAMRRILVDHARGKKRKKRGHGRKRATVDELLTVSRHNPDDVVAVHEVLADLETLNPRQAQIVELRFFAGMTSGEVSDYLGVSKSTVDREWRVARAWLRKELSEDDDS